MLKIPAQMPCKSPARISSIPDICDISGHLPTLSSACRGVVSGLSLKRLVISLKHCYRSRSSESWLARCD